VGHKDPHSPYSPGFTVPDPAAEKSGRGLCPYSPFDSCPADTPGRNGHNTAGNLQFLAKLNYRQGIFTAFLRGPYPVFHVKNP
jgi:hypothetical protein